jgi:hypothetical protein
MRCQERVLVVGSWLNLAPIAVEDVLARIDEPPSVSDGASIDRVRAHRRIMTVLPI